MASEIQLITQIEKYEFLYNFNLPEYNRKDVVEEAWANVAANTNMSVSDCKEKWRNIRSSFLRSLKPTHGYKLKKPYYLTEYLQFILPYLKINAMENNSTDNSNYDTQQNIENSDDIAVYIKEEPADGENNDNNSDNAVLSDLITRKLPIMRKRRRFISARKNNSAEPLKVRSKETISNLTRNQTSAPDISKSLNNSDSPLKMFLMSLLPELESMTEDQVRTFKIKSMILIDEIKVNYSQVRQNMSSVNNERLQKRLINLLLKNLERTTKTQMEVDTKPSDNI